MGKWNQFTEKHLGKITNNLRKKRIDLFVEKLGLGKDDLILDLGSENGAYLSSHYPYPENIVLGDIKEGPMKEGVKKYGLKGYKVLDQEGKLPFDDNEFDAVWCNSVIEHVTLNKDDLDKVSAADFKRIANEHQQEFASEIQRVGKKFFVQTPLIHFPVESHSWLPIVQYLPHPMHYKLSRRLKKFWLKQWTADYYLYNRKRFESHFSDATEIYIERAMGLGKSIMAIKY